MFYCCNHCQYVFPADQNPQCCPDCGELSVRPATVEETDEHLHLLEIIASESWDDAAEYGLGQISLTEK